MQLTIYGSEVVRQKNWEESGSGMFCSQSRMVAHAERPYHQRGITETGCRRLNVVAMGIGQTQSVGVMATTCRGASGTSRMFSGVAGFRRLLKVQTCGEMVAAAMPDSQSVNFPNLLSH
jgi:hypothetical protein